MNGRFLRLGCLQLGLGLVTLAYIASWWVFPQLNRIPGLVFILALGAVCGIYTYVVSLRPSMLQAQKSRDPADAIQPDAGERAQVLQTIMSKGFAIRGIVALVIIAASFLIAPSIGFVIDNLTGRPTVVPGVFVSPTHVTVSPSPVLTTMAAPAGSTQTVSLTPTFLLRATATATLTPALHLTLAPAYSPTQAALFASATRQPPTRVGSTPVPAATDTLPPPPGPTDTLGPPSTQPPPPGPTNTLSPPPTGTPVPPPATSTVAPPATNTAPPPTGTLIPTATEPREPPTKTPEVP
jgi:hypothetical protein